MEHVQLSLGMILNMPFLFKGIAIVLGSFILSVRINFFLVPFELLDGGIIGLGLIIKYVLGIKAGLTIIVLSIPIFAMAWFCYEIIFIIAYMEC